MKIICAWCPKTTAVENHMTSVEIVSHGICRDCIATHFPELADEPANTFPGRVVGNPANASVPDSSGVKAGVSFGPARSLFARSSIGLSADGIEGIEEGPRRSLFSPRNRFRRGVLGNLLMRAGQLRRVA